MKKLYTLALAALVGVCAVSAQKVMRIHHLDGTTETKNVTDVTKITFEDADAPVDPTEPTGPQMVDMGLSVKWATYNIGATKPEEYGNFYAYGEIEPKTEYTLENYKWYYYDYNDWDCDEWEKYYKLGDTFTGTMYDVAHMKWGDLWRVPTRAEWNELINNCSFTWTGLNGVTGAIITSNINGNSIFLPAAGNMVDAEHTHDQLGCFYWTSSEYEQTDITQECRNYRANIDATNHSADGYDYPEVGFSIRAVYGPTPAHTASRALAPADDQAVDLGLSVKWAPFNLGATSSTGKGHFYAWGETWDKQYCHVYNYTHYDPYVDSELYIADDIAGTDYDAATALWGENWRMPTEAEMRELIEKCTWSVSSAGYTVTGPNGNSIFLPAAGMMTYKGEPRSSNESGYYWSSTADARTRPNGDPMLSMAVALRFYRMGYTLQSPEVTYTSRAAGIQIRPVHK